MSVLPRFETSVSLPEIQDIRIRYIYIQLILIELIYIVIILKI